MEENNNFLLAQPWPPGSLTTSTWFWCCYLATKRCVACSCVWCWPRQTVEQDVPERPWAPGSLLCPQLVCFSGLWAAMGHPLPPAITVSQQECKHMCMCSVWAVYALVHAQANAHCKVCTTRVPVFKKWFLNVPLHLDGNYRNYVAVILTII